MKNYGKKALSVFLAVLMCLTVAALDFSSLTAGAYTASPTHTFKLRVRQTSKDGGYDGQDGGGQYTLYGKNQNGSGSQTTISSGSLGTGWATVDGGTTDIGTFTSAYWPTSINIGCNICNNNSMFYKEQTVWAAVDISVLNAATNTYTDWVNFSNFSLTSNTKSGGGGSAYKNATSNNVGVYPYASKVATSASAAGNATDTVNITLNATGGANKTQGFNAYVYDQYNVIWTAAPSSWSKSGTVACTTSLSTTGASESNTLTMGPTNNTYQKAAVTVQATYGSLWHKWTVNITPTYKINFNVSTNGGTSTAPGSATVTNTNTGSANTSYTLQSSQTASKSNTTTGSWTFEGWNGSSSATSGTKPTSAITIDNYNDTLYAIFSRSATATFHWYNASGTKVTSTNTKKVYNNATSFTFDVPKSSVPTSITVNGTNYTFAGWAVDSTTKTTADHAASVTTATRNINTGSSYNFYALYTASVTLSYNNNGGSGTPAAQTGNLVLNCGANATAANNTSGQATFTINPNNTVMSRAYASDFIGWNTTQKNDETAQYKDGTVTWSASSGLPSTITIKKNTTLYASYYDFRYNVKFYDYSGALLKQETVRHNTSATAPTMKTNASDPSHTDSGSHYVFDHWEYTNGSAYANSDKLVNATNGYTFEVWGKYVGHQHIWGDPYALDGATTCTSGLKYKMDCTVCGYTRQFEEEPLGHDYEVIGVAEATCTRTGSYGKSVCKNCGALDPDYSVVIDGVETVITDDNRIIPALGHDYGVERDPDTGAYIFKNEAGEYIKQPETVAASCTTPGYYYYTCARCGNELKVENIPAKGHDWDAHDEVPATCTETGISAYTVCKNCGLYLVDKEVLPALGHDYVLVEETDSTCTVKGHYAYYECSRCGKYFDTDADKTEIADISVKDKDLIDHDYQLTEETAPTCTEPGYSGAYVCTMCGQLQPGTEPAGQTDPLGHDISLYLEAKAPTCIAIGNSAVYKCARCGKFFSDAAGENEIAENSWNIAKVNHSMENKGIAATCTEPGKAEYFYCSLCEKYYADKNGTTEIDPDSVETIAALGHLWSEWAVVVEPTDMTEGEEQRFCMRCGEPDSKVLEKLPHELTLVEAKDPTCTAYGNIAYYLCANCGNKFSDEAGENLITEVSIAPLGHDLVKNDEACVAPTCVEEGKDVFECSRCDYVETVAVPATGIHTEVDYGIASEAKCNATGLIPGKRCAVCGEILVEAEVIPMIPHTPKVVPAVAPTCTTEGSAEGSECAVCGEKLTIGAVIPATGHTLCDWDPDREEPATCTNPGKKIRFCVNCDYSETKETPVLGHQIVIDKAVPATCEAAGLTEGYHCARCDEYAKAQEEIPALGHNYTVTVVAPTCTKVGYSEFVCANCGDTYRDNYTEKLDHVVGTPATCTDAAVCANCGRSFGTVIDHDYVLVSSTDSTCTVAGVRTYTCSMCGDTYTETKELLDHRLTTEGSYGVEPTCTERGYSAMKCEMCGEIIITYDDAPLGHDYQNGKCTRCGEADPNYKPDTPATPSSEKCSKCGLNHNGRTGLWKQDGLFCRIIGFFRNLFKVFGR